jgi:Flp pilus assembly protein TadG
MAKRRNWRDEEGAAIVMVAGAMLVIMGMAALVIDLGNGWRTRRALIPATDAGALAAAQAYVTGENGCGGIHETYVLDNEAAAFDITCDQPGDPDADHGRVTVTASHNVETWFASAIGLGDFEVQSTSTAAWAPAGGVYGLRPIGLCLAGSSQLQDLVDNPPDVPTDITIMYDKDQPDACGDDTFVPGNWGSIDFTGIGNNFKDWVEFGYDGLVGFEYHDVSACDDDHCYIGDTGNLPGAKNELDGLVGGDYFTLPVFNYVNDLPGNNAEFHIAAILRVRLMSYKLTGQPSTHFFTFRVKPGLVVGPCCAGGGGGGSAGNKVIAICGVDPGQFEACEP